MIPPGRRTACKVEGCEKAGKLTRGLCVAHYSRLWRSGTMPAHNEERIERIWRSIEYTDTCWLWKLSRNPLGYGKIKFENRSQPAHRVVYELAVGPIPDGLELDHLCRVRHCVNPAHLEPVTPLENMRRSLNPNMRAHLADTCVQGHPVSDENTYRNPRNGKKQCRICLRAWRERRSASG